MDPVEPATPFMEGYRRSEEMRVELLEAVRSAMLVCPQERLGQLLANAVGGGTDLFNIYDEELAKRLREYARKRPHG